ncbi:shikimate kinase [bacterium]|nr:shikimate kinase [bacterium]
MMGAGKSTIGKALAQKLGIQFVDLDRTIEAATSMSVREIFKQKGEDYFRDIESKTLRKTADSVPSVIALGGGALSRIENLKFIKETGRSIYLRAPVNILIANLRERSERPLIAEEPTEEALKTKLEALLQKRRENYEACDFVLDINRDMSVDDIANRIVELLRA